MHTHISHRIRDRITTKVIIAQKKNWHTNIFHSGYFQEYGWVDTYRCRNDSQKRWMNKKSTPTSVKVSTLHLLAQVTDSYRNPSIVQPVSHLPKPSFTLPDTARCSSWHLVYFLCLRSILAFWRECLYLEETSICKIRYPKGLIKPAWPRNLHRECTLPKGFSKSFPSEWVNN